MSWIAIRCGNVETIIPADHPDLDRGWNELERDGKTIWRWTDGAAVIPWQKLQDFAVVTIRGSPVDRYPVYDERARIVA